MTQNGSANYVYDDENRLIATGGMSYVYDGDGQRVEKCTQGTSPGKCASGATGTLYWAGISGQVDAETDLSGNITANYIYFGGGRIAKRDPSKAVHFYYSDHLGSTSLITDANGTMAPHPQSESDYYPYGGEIVITADSTSNHYKYTGKERDSESGLDNFGARYDSSALGRFMTPDWDAKATAVPYAKFGDPQTLNLYAFVENAPINKVDGDGHCPLDGASDGPSGGACPTLRKEDVAAVKDSVDRSNRPTDDDKKGKNHEEAVVTGKDKDGNHAIVPSKPGAYSDVTKEGNHAVVDPSVAADPSKQHTIQTPEVVAHVHPAGTATKLSIGADGQTSLKTSFWKQPPSTGPGQDLSGAIPAPGINLVVGAGTTGNASGSPTVYFFNSRGITCTESYDNFKKSGN